jgi:hypothetical protein
MKLKVSIQEVKTVNEFDFYWKSEDFIKLLDEFNFPDADKSKPEDLISLLHMAISDFEPDEAARILLHYKLGEKLNEGQIHSISHEMMKDRVAEEYPEPALHLDLFSVNQLLYKAYNGKFINTEASIIDLEVSPLEASDQEINKEVLIKALSAGLKDSNLIKRLFPEQLNGSEEFTDAANTVWKVEHTGGNAYRLVTSKYWVAREEISDGEYETEIQFFEAEE